MIANDEDGAIVPVRCPYCDPLCECEFMGVDDWPIQCGPHHCALCGAVEGGTWDTSEEFAAEGDAVTEWYPPTIALHT